MRVRAGRGTQEQDVDQRKDDRVRADADGQHRERHAGENGTCAQAAEPELEVPPQVVGGAETVYVAALFLDHLQASHAGQRRTARLLRSHAAPDVLGDLQLHVRPQLCVELAFERLATEEIQQTNGEKAQVAHDDSSSDRTWRGGTARLAYVACNAKSIATETRRQLRASASACRRPADVNS